MSTGGPSWRLPSANMKRECCTYLGQDRAAGGMFYRAIAHIAHRVCLRGQRAKEE